MLRRRARPVHVLVAEDDADVRSQLVAGLRQEGYRVLEARDGLDLLDLIGAWYFPGTKAAPIDLVISDIRMPGQSGLDVLSTLGRLSRRIPVILITGYPDEETRAKARDLGAAALLVKPFGLSDLKAVVARVLRERAP